MTVFLSCCFRPGAFQLFGVGDPFFSGDCLVAEQLVAAGEILQGIIVRCAPWQRLQHAHVVGAVAAADDVEVGVVVIGVMLLFRGGVYVDLRSVNVVLAGFGIMVAGGFENVNPVVLRCGDGVDIFMSGFPLGDLVGFDLGAHHFGFGGHAGAFERDDDFGVVRNELRNEHEGFLRHGFIEQYVLSVVRGIDNAVVDLKVEIL